MHIFQKYTSDAWRHFVWNVYKNGLWKLRFNQDIGADLIKRNGGEDNFMKWAGLAHKGCYDISTK